MKEEKKLSRRDVIKSAGLVSGGMILGHLVSCVSNSSTQALSSASVEILELRTSRCSGCGQCVEACPYEDVLKVVEKGKQMVGRCNSCGTCYEVCPLRAVHHTGTGKHLIEEKTVLYNLSRCIGCMRCLEVCPVEAIAANELEKKVEVDLAACIGCGNCLDPCPTMALHGLGMAPEPRIDYEACSSEACKSITGGTVFCVENCPQNAIGLIPLVKRNRQCPNREECKAACISACPYDALFLVEMDER